MACPYFEPGERIPLSSGSLGDLYAGLCRADSAERHVPADTTLADRCNLGYARGYCSHFPPGDGPDAVRFSISTQDDSGVAIRYSVERDHLPFSHGALRYSTADGAFVPAPPPLVERLAAAYMRSYLRRLS